VTWLSVCQLWTVEIRSILCMLR